MTWNVGIYPTEDAAKDVAAKLTKAGFRERKALFASRVAGSEESAVQALSKDAALPRSQVGECAKHLREGKSLVAVVPAERAAEATQILQEGALQTLKLTPVVVADAPPRKSNAAPLSDWLGIRVLRKSAPTQDIQLSDDPTPLSSRLNWKALSNAKPTARLSDDPTPLSSLLNWKVLRKSAPTQDIQLSDNPTPLSTRMNWKVLGKSGPTQDIQLRNNPAPLSSMLGLPTLIRRER